MRVEGERECVHWSELGHQGRVRKEDEKEREMGNERRRELFTAAVTASCCCLPGGRIEDLWQFCTLCFVCARVCGFKACVNLHVRTCVMHVCFCVCV